MKYYIIYNLITHSSHSSIEEQTGITEILQLSRTSLFETDPFGHDMMYVSAFTNNNHCTTIAIISLKRRIWLYDSPMSCQSML